MCPIKLRIKRLCRILCTLKINIIIYGMTLVASIYAVTYESTPVDKQYNIRVKRADHLSDAVMCNVEGWT